MTVFQSDRASAELDIVEEGALKALASLGYNADIGDVHEFCEGFSRRNLTFGAVRNALLSLDALGWVRADGDEPLRAMAWSVRPQGRVALEGVKS